MISRYRKSYLILCTGRHTLLYYLKIIFVLHSIGLDTVHDPGVPAYLIALKGVVYC